MLDTFVQVISNAAYAAFAARTVFPARYLPKRGYFHTRLGRQSRPTLVPRCLSNTPRRHQVDARSRRAPRCRSWAGCLQAGNTLSRTPIDLCGCKIVLGRRGGVKRSAGRLFVMDCPAIELSTLLTPKLRDAPVWPNALRGLHFTEEINKESPAAKRQVSSPERPPTGRGATRCDT